MNKDDHKAPTAARAASRSERLAEELRANLVKRRTQARARRSAARGDEEAAPAPQSQSNDSHGSET